MELNEVIIEVSKNCNLSCIMCGYGQEENTKSKFISNTLFEEIIQQINGKTEKIRLNGRGESTIHPDFLDFIDYMKAQGLGNQCNLFTNLSFSNEKLIESFIDNSFQLFISFDSPIKEELESIRCGAKFRLILNNIELLSEIDPIPFLVFTIQEANHHRILDMARFSFEHGFNLIFNTVRMDKGIEKFQKVVSENQEIISDMILESKCLFDEEDSISVHFPTQIAGIKISGQSIKSTYGELASCPALNSELCVLHNGDVTPCNMFNPYVYGNILDTSLEDVWNGQRRQDFLQNHKNHFYCQNCACLGVS